MTADHSSQLACQYHSESLACTFQPYPDIDSYLRTLFKISRNTNPSIATPPFAAAGSAREAARRSGSLTVPTQRPTWTAEISLAWLGLPQCGGVAHVGRSAGWPDASCRKVESERVQGERR
jgi:hypothetical protein